MDYKNLDVIVLTYNRAKYLEIMLDSLCTQVATGFNIKVLNNCSTDNTIEVIENIKKKYPERNIQIITNEKNLGNPGNFKRSQEIATNEYTAIFHDDDAIHPEYIETAMQIFKDNPDMIMCSGNLYGMWNVSNNDWGILHKDYYKYKKNDGVYFNLLINRPTFASNIYKTQAYKQIEYRPDLFGKLHDIIFMLEINRLGAVGFITGACIKWRQSQNNDSNDLSTGPFPNEIANIAQKIKELNKEHRFIGQPLLWNFIFWLYRWSVLKRFLTWYEFEELLIKNGTFSKLEAFLFHKKFYIEFFNNLIRKRAEHYRKKVVRTYAQDTKILSICIPTYNGSKYIKENLDILISQIQENQINDVEIVVSDNCSTDSIPEIMNEYTKKYPSFIKYSRNEKNLGYDGNVMKCCEIAQGKFIHLLGDDDFYTLNGLQRLYSVLTNNKDLSVLVLSNSYLRQDYYLEIVSRKYLNEEFILEDRLYINDSDKFIRDIEDRAWPNTNLVFRKDYFFKIPNIREFYKKDWIHLYILIYIAKKWQNCYLFADKFPIVVDRVGVQTWLNNSDGPRIYFNNLWVYSFLDKLGYDKKVFNWYRKKILYEYSKNIQYRRSTNLFINLKYLIKYFPYFKDIPRFYYSFAPKFIYDKGLKGIFSVTNRYSKERRIKEKILTFCFIDKRISVKRIDKKNFSIYKKFPPKELILLLKGGTYVQAVPSIICRPMLNKLELSSNKNIEEIKLAKHLKSCLKQRYIYYSTFLKLFERFKYLQTK